MSIKIGNNREGLCTLILLARILYHDKADILTFGKIESTLNLPSYQVIENKGKTTFLFLFKRDGKFEIEIPQEFNFATLISTKHEIDGKRDLGSSALDQKLQPLCFLIEESYLHDFLNNKSNREQCFASANRQNDITKKVSLAINYLFMLSDKLKSGSLAHTLTEKAFKETLPDFPCISDNWKRGVYILNLKKFTIDQVFDFSKLAILFESKEDYNTVFLDR